MTAAKNRKVIEIDISGALLDMFATGIDVQMRLHRIMSTMLICFPNYNLSSKKVSK